MELARMIPDDGEGATHLITIDVEGCRDREQARTIARAVADSPLVKTAIHGADPNWGRIVSAAGYAGVAFEEHDLSLWLNEVAALSRRRSFRRSTPLHSPRSCAAERDTHIRLVLTAHGNAACRFWTCDLTSRVCPAQCGLHDLKRWDRFQEVVSDLRIAAARGRSTASIVLRWARRGPNRSTKSVRAILAVEQVLVVFSDVIRQLAHQCGVDLLEVRERLATASSTCSCPSASVRAPRSAAAAAHG